MLECSKKLLALAGMLAAGCAAAPEAEPPQPVTAPQASASVAPPAPTVDVAAQRMEEARAMLAQAETDVQRARAKRALWSKAWEDLIAARNATASRDAEAAIRLSREASELAQLGLEQLAYPAVK
jgi:hypothetical protein